MCGIIETMRHENLNLSLLNSFLYLSPRVFSCKTLVVLKLKNLCIDRDEFSADLPLLKTLELYDVVFEYMKQFMKVLSGSPKLEHLVTTDVVDESWEGYSEEPLLPNLISADVSLYKVPLTALYNARFLTLFWVGHDDLPYQHIKPFDKTFQNLIQLELRGNLDWSELLRILRNSPKLQDFTTSMLLPTSKDWKYPYNVPGCVSCHLKTCSIEIYRFAEDDNFQFATYILKNARFLENMTIDVKRYENQAQKTKALEDLTTCTKISPTCQLSLINDDGISITVNCS